MDTFASSDLDFLIAHQNGKRYYTQYLIFNFVSYDRLTILSHQYSLSVSSVFIPKSYQEALMYPKWKHAIDDEMDALISRQT